MSEETVNPTIVQGSAIHIVRMANVEGKHQRVAVEEEPFVESEALFVPVDGIGDMVEGALKFGGRTFHELCEACGVSVGDQSLSRWARKIARMQGVRQRDVHGLVVGTQRHLGEGDFPPDFVLLARIDGDTVKLGVSLIAVLRRKDGTMGEPVPLGPWEKPESRPTVH